MLDPMPNSTAPPQGEATQLLVAWSGGDRSALDKLMPLVLKDLQRRADCILRGQPVGHILQADALVNEAFIKLVQDSARSWQNRAHFLAVASRAMRQILIDHARGRRCSRRSGSWVRVPADIGLAVSVDHPDDLMTLDEVLTKLADKSPRACRVVEMRCFAGATVEEIAQALGISRITVLRDWKFATDSLRENLSPKRA